MNIYETFYNLLETYVFGNAIAVGSFQELIAILFATSATIFAISIPFIVVFKAIKVIMGG